MLESVNKTYQSFCDNTKNVFYYITICILSIFIFIISPFKVEGYKYYTIRLFIITLLSYSLYILFTNSKALFNIEHLFTDPNLETIRNNCLLNIVFIFSLSFFICFIIRDIFY